MSKKIIEWIPTIIIIICVIFFNHFFYGLAITSGDSMNNNLNDGDILISQKFNLSEINRFDIISFRHTYDDGKRVYFIKRVIALPNETIKIDGNNIYINGELIEEDYGNEEMQYQGIAANEIVLGDNEYFVLGDNRSISFDSRYEEVGLIKADDIKMKMLCRIIPLLKKL